MKLKLKLLRLTQKKHYAYKKKSVCFETIACNHHEFNLMQVCEYDSGSYSKNVKKNFHIRGQ